MAKYKLLAPHYLGTRYYAEGSVVEYDGAPSKQMEAVDGDGQRRIEERGAKPEPVKVTEVPTPGGEPADPTWAPQTRPAFSVKRLRKPNPNDPDDQATIVREAASPPSASSAPAEGPSGLKEPDVVVSDAKVRKGPNVPRKNRVSTRSKKSAATKSATE